MFSKKLTPLAGDNLASFQTILWKIAACLPCICIAVFTPPPSDCSITLNRITLSRADHQTLEGFSAAPQLWAVQLTVWCWTQAAEKVLQEALSASSILSTACTTSPLTTLSCGRAAFLPHTLRVFTSLTMCCPVQRSLNSKILHLGNKVRALISTAARAAQPVSVIWEAQNFCVPCSFKHLHQTAHTFILNCSFNTIRWKIRGVSHSLEARDRPQSLSWQLRNERQIIPNSSMSRNLNWRSRQLWGSL